jgi:uncharacterized protein YndB with AHSA1/START domain/uncharacterized protein YciI
MRIRKRSCPTAVFLTMIALAIVLMPAVASVSHAQTKEPPVPEYQHYLARLLGTRPTWPDDVTEDEEKIMGEHFLYLRDLTAEKKVLMAGPVFDFKFGLVVLQVKSEAEAKEILDNDPSVKNGLHTYDMSTMTASLQAHNMPGFRYAKDISDRVVRKEEIIPAPRADVWRAWTTTEGINSFFSPNALIELRPGGRYEIYFSMDAPYGGRGSEDCHVLAFVPEELLCFEWNAPPQFPELRRKRTQVIIRFSDEGTDKTRLELTQVGWGSGPKWNEVYDYFDAAWGRVVENCRKRFEEGPLFDK